jgi:hypothetical protein
MSFRIPTSYALSLVAAATVAWPVALVMVGPRASLVASAAATAILIGLLFVIHDDVWTTAASVIAVVWSVAPIMWHVPSWAFDAVGVIAVLGCVFFLGYCIIVGEMTLTVAGKALYLSCCSLVPLNLAVLIAGLSAEELPRWFETSVGVAVVVPVSWVGFGLFWGRITVKEYRRPDKLIRPELLSAHQRHSPRYVAEQRRSPTHGD